jgi:hypothetical protein
MSNHHDDPWEVEMTRTFDQRVRDLHEAPLTLDHVKGKAGRIRRNRRIAAAAAGLATAAVIIPIAVFAGQGLTDDDSGPAPADTPSPNPTAVDPGSLGFGYLEGRTLHLEDGSTVELPERYYGVTLLGEEILAVRNDDTGLDVLDVIDEAGSVSESIEIQSGPVVNDDHTVVAYLERDGSLYTRFEDGGFGLTTDLGPNASLAAVTGAPDCDAADPCRVYVNDDTVGAPTVIDSSGERAEAVPDAIKVNDAGSTGLVTVQNKSTIDGSCGGIYDQSTGRYVWETCDAYLFDLSPDSRYVDATHAYLDGLGNSYAAILDATNGNELARLSPPEGTITRTAWQDDEHLLATVYGPEGWTIERLGVDGTVEQVVGPTTKGDDLTPAYTLLGGA